MIWQSSLKMPPRKSCGHQLLCPLTKSGSSVSLLYRGPVGLKKKITLLNECEHTQMCMTMMSNKERSRRLLERQLRTAVMKLHQWQLHQWLAPWRFTIRDSFLPIMHEQLQPWRKAKSLGREPKRLRWRWERPRETRMPRWARSRSLSIKGPRKLRAKDPASHGEGSGGVRRGVCSCYRGEEVGCRGSYGIHQSGLESCG